MVFVVDVGEVLRICFVWSHSVWLFRYT